jgi:methylated-DNA-[protein]-cysteine S-methyltransferase
MTISAPADTLRPDEGEIATDRDTGAFATVGTPNGPFTVIADDRGRVLASGWTEDPAYLSVLIHRSLRPESLHASAGLGAVTDAVTAYYDGELSAIDAIPTVQSSGPFVEQAWMALREVPAGGPVSYTRFAELSGNGLAVRGAATACARNAAALFVPCHRVLRSNGSLGGFRYGVDVKRWLLDHEAPAAA